jgi:predicted RNA binding protein YcfA (HicA-like mRNA interferase family)
LERAGFKLTRVRGSHHMMRHPDGRSVPVPVHPGRDMPKGTLRSVLSIIGMDVDELRDPPTRTTTSGRSTMYHGLVNVCRGLRVKVVLTVTGSPSWSTPKQPMTWYKCRLPPVVSSLRRPVLSA